MNATLIPTVPGVAGFCAAGAVMAFPGRTAKRRLDLIRPRTAGTRRRDSIPTWKLLGPALAAGLLSALVLHSPILAMVLPIAAWRASRAWHRRVARLAADRRREETLAMCLALRAELRGGRDALDALRDAAEATCPQIAKQLEEPLSRDGDVVFVLREAARDEGREALNLLAACWHASEGGAGLARAVGRLATTLRAAETQRREVGAELAGVRASSRLLAALPAIGLVLGSGMGADPVHVLLTTVVGQACLAVGGACVLAGLAWMERIVRSSEVAA